MGVLDGFDRRLAALEDRVEQLETWQSQTRGVKAADPEKHAEPTVHAEPEREPERPKPAGPRRSPTS